MVSFDALILGLLALPAAAVAALALAVAALQRANRAMARVAELELELEKRSRGAESFPIRGAAVRTAPPPPQPPVPEAVAPSPPPAEEPGEVHAPAPAEVATPPPAAPSARPVEPQPSGSETLEDRPAASAAAAPPATAPPAFGEGTWSPPGSFGPNKRARWIPVDWERWVGVRGAAVVGGLALALAALLLFQYSVEHGLISPGVRVSMGIAAGLLSLVFSERLHHRQQRAAASALSGAGAVALYASLWAARVMYALIPAAVAAGLMFLVTLVSALIADRRRTLLTALIALAGGFATPLMVGQQIDRPTALFGYILVLDLALLWLAVRRGWAVLAGLSLAVTLLYEGRWIVTRMDSSGLLLGLVILGLFAVVFVAASEVLDLPESDRKTFAAGSLLLPMALALHTAARSELEVRPAPLAVLLALLTVMAIWLARRRAVPWLALAVTGGNLGVIFAWFAGGWRTPALSREAVASWCVLALTVHLAATTRRLPEARDTSVADPLLSGGLLLLFLGASLSPHATGLWWWLAGWVFLSALLVAHSVRLVRPALLVPAAIGSSLSFAYYVVARAGAPWLPAESVLLAVALGIALVWQGVALSPASKDVRPWAGRGAALAPLILLLAPLGLADSAPYRPVLELGSAGLLVVLTAVTATRLGDGRWFAAAVGGMAVAVTSWVGVVGPGARGIDGALAALLVAFGVVALLTAWPALAHPRFATSRAAWNAAALAGPGSFFALLILWREVFGKEAQGFVPLVLAGLSLLVYRASRNLLRDAPVGRIATIWLLAVTLSLVSIAIPLQLNRSWITIGWAVNGVAVLLLWRRIDVPGLKYFGLALLGAAAVRLTLNPAVLHYFPRGRLPVLNWVLYTYWVPAAALIAGWKLLKDVEVERLRVWEQGLFGRRAGGAAASGLAALAVIFVWLNLVVVDLFSTGPVLTLSMERQPARDLAFSIAWALYALLLLALGMRWASGVLRRLSLALLVATLAKVFLYDLGRLTDLYRVASLAGLAVSLILVSLAYQRFVLRKEEPTPESEEQAR